MYSMNCHVVDDELALGDEVVVLDFAFTEVVADVLQDCAQSLSTLRSGGVVDHVLGDEVVEDVVVAGALSAVELFHNRLRICHRHIVLDAVQA